MEKTDDALLWRRMKSGDQESFSQIFKFYYPKLYAYGVKLIPFPDFVRDQIQDLFITIWQNREGLGDVSNLLAYLFVSLRRRILIAKKAKLNMNPLDDISEEDSQSLVFDPDEFIDKVYLSVHIKDKLVRNLNALPVSQREIIFLRFYHRLTYREIAAIVQIKEQSIKNNMPRILQKLSEGLTGISEEDINDMDIMLFNLFLLFQKK
ncbi:RNA polymerase sigma factor [Gaoshiqia sp. Z1-71]|uniref:RNA polymerase sigma factor n=1 Tax=Gaoshiqia hydrogeniformans TaxID=3290090 RepID=UPI003BF8CCA9